MAAGFDGFLYIGSRTHNAEHTYAILSFQDGHASHLPSLRVAKDDLYPCTAITPSDCYNDAYMQK